MIVGATTSVLLETGGAAKIVAALTAQGYQVVYRTDRETTLELVNPEAAEAVGDSQHVELMLPPGMGLSKLLQRMMNKRKGSRPGQPG